MAGRARYLIGKSPDPTRPMALTAYSALAAARQGLARSDHHARRGAPCHITVLYLSRRRPCVW